MLLPSLLHASAACTALPKRKNNQNQICVLAVNAYLCNIITGNLKTCSEDKNVKNMPSVRPKS
jgi:hypothetical protein